MGSFALLYTHRPKAMRQNSHRRKDPKTELKASLLPKSQMFVALSKVNINTIFTIILDLFIYFETGNYIAQAGLELTILLL